MIIRAYGEPAPQGSKRVAFRGNATRKAIIVDSSEKTTPWRSDVINAAQKSIYEVRDRGDEFAPFAEAIVARMVFSFWRPKTVKFNKRPFMTVAPDVSKLLRSTEDALKAAGVIVDDSLIVEYTRVAKVYCGEDPEALESPGCLIVLGNLLPDQQLTQK